MSIAASMAKRGYMPKARNKAREEAKIANDFKESSSPAIEEKEKEKEMAANPATSAASKAASAMWLKNRIPPKVAQPGQTNSDMATMTGSRYGTQTSLPYRNPGAGDLGTGGNGIRGSGKSPFAPKVSAEDRSESKSIDKADMDSLTSRHKSRKELMKFVMNAQFADKPRNRLVRQCTHCQMLYSSSHVCRASVSNQGDNTPPLALEYK